TTHEPFHNSPENSVPFFDVFVVEEEDAPFVVEMFLSDDDESFESHLLDSEEEYDPFDNVFNYTVNGDK
ncbi:MAG: hypothetical protein FWD31_14480, partial [Planctomycetaceae bacterium]|nr:hypothetical protein [Planctomycetaceae bacterium]